MGKLYRSSNKVIAGVCAGVAEYFGFDAKIVRLIALLCLIFGGCGAVAYVILWVLMPLQKEKSYAERLKERIDNGK